MRQGIVFSIIVAVVFCAPVWAYDWSTNQGTGDPNDPYQISTPEQLIAIGTDPNLLDKNFVLTNDIIFDPNNNPDHVFDGAVIPDFKGSIDGCGFTVKDLTISISTYSGKVGLIGILSVNGRLENLNIENASITTITSQEVGILCGFNKGGYIHNCQVRGTITSGGGDGGTGGICGGNFWWGKITHCRADIIITTPADSKTRLTKCGGICGDSSGTIARCSSSGTISAYSLAETGGICGGFSGDIISSSSSIDIIAERYLEFSGGLCGQVYQYGDISHSYATGNLRGGIIGRVGGFCGSFGGGIIEVCYSTGNVICGPKNSHSSYYGEESGGFCGFIESYSYCEIRNCFSSGDLICGPTAPDLYPYRSVGGFCWKTIGLLENCYSTGKIETDAEVKAGFCFEQRGDMNNCFWDIESSETMSAIYSGDGAGVVGKSTTEMQDMNTFLDAGWDFVGETANGQEDIWTIYPGQYPSFLRQTYSGGDGSPQNPYLISSAQDLINLGKSPGDYYDYFILTKDIDLSGHVFDNSVIAKNTFFSPFPMGNTGFRGTPFYGNFNGQGHAIDHLTIHATEKSYVGLFGLIGSKGVVNNLFLTNVDISVSGEGVINIGGFCGENDGIISRCSVSGRIEGTNRVGGICGTNAALIQDCYASCQLVCPGSFSGVGGVCAANVLKDFSYASDWRWGLIERCYSSCSIESSGDKKGGFVGYLMGDVRDCYWDTTVSGLTEAYYYLGIYVGLIENIQGYTTAEMKQRANFSNWDFENIWWIDEGNDYPRLRFEINSPPVADAGADQTVFASLDGCAMVSLDGTGSFDEDGDVLEYYWFNDANELITTGAEPNVILPVGEHVIDLIVNDGIEDSEPNSCVVTVVDPFEALAGGVTELVQHDGIANSLLAKVHAALKVLEDGNENNDGAAVGSLQAFIHAVNAQRGKKISEDDADYLITLARQIIDML